MNIGPGPDLSGNVTGGPVCVACGAGATGGALGGGAPPAYFDYGGMPFLRPYSDPANKPGMPPLVCTSGNCKTGPPGSTSPPGSTGQPGQPERPG